MEESSRDPLEIFPAEIWELILEQTRKQGSSRDVLNCSKVCTEFQRILEPTKQEWLFGSICPFILPYLKGGELLACRRICKTWRRGVDNFLEDSETWRPFNEGTSDLSRSSKYDPLEQKRIKWTKIKGEYVLDKFLEGLQNQEMQTPFVGRSLSLEGWNGGHGRTRKKVLEMLSLYGDQILHLCVVYAYYSSHFFQILQQIFGCTPNLKSFILDFDNHNFYGPYADESNLENLEDRPLPKIISLESLEIRTTSSPQLIIFEKLSSKIDLWNLKCLKLHNSYPYNNVKPYAVGRPLQHLTELHVSGIHWNDLEHILANMISPTAPLGKLNLDFGVDFKEIDAACNLISRWKETLRILVIKGNHTSCKEPLPKISLSKLDAPNLKSLEVEDIVFATSALPPALTTSLEYLHIRYNCSQGLRIGPGMEFYRCVFGAGELHKSTIWGELKRLKVIRVERLRWNGGKEKVVCTREMHECGIKAKICTK